MMNEDDIINIRNEAKEAHELAKIVLTKILLPMRSNSATCAKRRKTA